MIFTQWANVTMTQHELVAAADGVDAVSHPIWCPRLRLLCLMGGLLLNIQPIHAAITLSVKLR